MRRFLAAASVALTLALGACATGSPPPPAVAETPLVPEVRVDERVELFAIIFRLAGADEYSRRHVPAYADAVDAHFAPFKNHPAVLAAKKLRAEQGVSYNAVVDLAVQLGPFPGLVERTPLDGAQLDPRWKAGTARPFVEQARAFAVDTGAAAFFAQQRPLYEVAERRMRNLIANEADLRWVQNFYGGSGEEKFIVIPAPINGQVAYGSRYYGPEGEREFYSTINAIDVDEDGRPAFGVGVAGLLVHEFGHSYVTPLVVERYEELRPSGELLMQTFGPQMRAQGYPEGSIVIHESIIRAGVARYKLAHVGEAAARRELDRQRRLGFLWIDELYDLLGTYERSRDRYPTFVAFFPAVRDYFAGLGPRLPALVAAYDATRPSIVEVSPSNGAQNVDPATKALRIRFDRPIQGNWGWKPPSGNMGEWPQFSEIALDESGTVLTATMKLKPDTAYEAEFLGHLFVSKEGVPMGPYSLKFRTGAAR